MIETAYFLILDITVRTREDEDKIHQKKGGAEAPKVDIDKYPHIERRRILPGGSQYPDNLTSSGL